MTPKEFVSVCTVLVCCDSWPLHICHYDIISGLLDRQAKFWGYEDWKAAYHEIHITPLEQQPGRATV